MLLLKVEMDSADKKLKIIVIYCPKQKEDNQKHLHYPINKKEKDKIKKHRTYILIIIIF